MHWSLLYLAVLCVIFNEVWAGKCVPLQNYDELNPFYASTFTSVGLTRSVCYPTLIKSYSNFWVEDEVIAQTLNPQVCAAATQLILDDPVDAITNIFTSDSPSKNCQKLLVSSACLYHFPKCDPTTGQPPTTKDKPCHFMCELFSPEWVADADNNPGTGCDSNDVAYLKLNGFDPTTAPEFDCSSTRWADPSSTECTSVKILPHNPPAPRCEVYTGSFCQPVFNDNFLVYIDPAFQQSEIENELWTQAYFFNVLPYSFNPLDEPARIDALRNLCLNAFQECYTVGLTLKDKTTNEARKIQRALPLRPDMQVCNAWHKSFSSTPFFEYLLNLVGPELASAALPPCDNTYTFGTHFCLAKQGLKNYLSTHEIYPFVLPTPDSTKIINGYTYASEYHPNVQSVPTLACPFPTVEPDDLDGPNGTKHTIFGSRCAPECPSNRYTSDEYHSIMFFTDIFSIVTLATSLLLVLTFTLFSSQRHKRLVYWLIISYIPIAFMIFLSPRVSTNNTYDFQCRSNTEITHFDGFPLFQGIVLVYFSLAFFYWWLMNAIDLFLRLILNRQYKRNSSAAFKRNLLMHIFSWGTPLLSLGGLLVGKYIGFDSMLPFSWAGSDPNTGYDPTALLWAFVLFPQIFVIVVGFSLMVTIIVFLGRHDNRVKQSTPTTNLQQQAVVDKATIGNMATPSTEFERLHLNLASTQHGFFYKIEQSIKMFAFVFMMIITWILELVYVVSYAGNSSKYEAALFQYEVCALTASHALDGSVYSTPCTLVYRLEPSIVKTFVASQLSPGLILFILYFLAQTDILQLWAYFFGKHLGISCLMQVGREDTDSTGNSTASSTHSHDTSDLLTRSDGTLRKQHGQSDTLSVERDPYGSDRYTHNECQFTPMETAQYKSKSDSTKPKKQLFKNMPSHQPTPYQRQQHSNQFISPQSPPLQPCENAKGGGFDDKHHENILASQIFLPDTASNNYSRDDNNTSIMPLALPQITSPTSQFAGDIYNLGLLQDSDPIEEDGMDDFKL